MPNKDSDSHEKLITALNLNNWKELSEYLLQKLQESTTIGETVLKKELVQKQHQKPPLLPNKRE